MVKRLVALLVLAALLLTGAAGCRSKSVESNGTESPTGGSVPTATVEVTPTADATAGAAADGEASDDAGAADAASAADTAAIKKELDAIQKELDGMSLPGDSDFDSIESDIP